jgi:hypothetical protein
MSFESPLDPYQEPQEKKNEALRVDPDVEQAIENEPISDKLKRQRLAAEMLKAYQQENPGEGIPEVEIIKTEQGEEERKSA